MIFYREVKWRGGTVRLAKIDNISHLLLYQVMSEINTYELDDIAGTKDNASNRYKVKKTSQISCVTNGNSALTPISPVPR